MMKNQPAWIKWISPVQWRKELWFRWTYWRLQQSLDREEFTLFPKTCALVEEVQASFAKWAVLLSPYDTPDHLEEVIKDLGVYLALLPGRECQGNFCTINAYAGVWRIYLKAFIQANPICQSWGEPKRKASSHREQLFAYPEYDPDTDFIDLGSLCFDVAREVVETAQL